jgi:integrase
MKPRAYGDGTVFWHTKRQRFIAEAVVGYGANGKKITRSGSGLTEAEALRKMRRSVAAFEKGLTPAARGYTVGKAVENWLTFGQSRRAGERTRRKYRDLCAGHITPQIGGLQVKRLTLEVVDTWLEDRAQVLATSSLGQVRRCLRNSIRRAVAQGLADHRVLQVVELAQLPRGQAGRPSKSLTLSQAQAVLANTRADPMHAYIVMSLLTGLRTEEVRALTWEHVHLDDDPPTVWIWRSDREGGDTKTEKSRRTLALPREVVTVLQGHRSQQNTIRAAVADRWQDSNHVFTTAHGTPLDAANVRRDFRRALQLVPEINAGDWTPRELRHSFVSLLSSSGIPVEEIARLVGHKGGSHVTELIYRKELRPVLERGAEAMDQIFAAKSNATPGKIPGTGTQVEE